MKAVASTRCRQLAGISRDLLKPYQRDALRDGIEEYRQAMAYSLDFSSSGLNLGNLYSNLGDRGDRGALLPARAEGRRPVLPGEDEPRGAAERAGRNAEAETLLREVVTAYPDNHDAAYSLGLLLVETGQAAGGRRVAGARRAGHAGQRARALQPRPAAPATRPVGRGRAALEAAALQPNRQRDFLLALGDHYLRRGRAGDAVALAERLIAAAPGQPVGQQLKAAAEQMMAAGGTR